MILVYSPDITSRHDYVFGFIFNEVLRTEFRLLSDIDEFIAYKGPKFSYAENASGEELNFKPAGILSQMGITPGEIQVMHWKGLPVFFPVNEGSAFPFDPFALCFYLLSRYEEYLPFTADEHGRFAPEQSLAYRFGFLNIALVDRIAGEIRRILKYHFPEINFPLPVFDFRPSFDIDIAYAHLEKDWLRAAGGLAKLILKLDLKSLGSRMMTLAGRRKDPYDNFDIQLEAMDEKGFTPVYFVLLGDYGKYDKNVSHKSRRFRELIVKLDRNACIGIHPSYNSFGNPTQLDTEIKRLAEIVERPVVISRQHFLRLRFPDSYRQLLESGISDDYSMGYASCNGFRAGTAYPFQFYDLLKEEITSLKIHPFIFMDTAMIDHLKFSHSESVNEVQDLLDEVRENGGEAIGIWHNYALGEYDGYEGWQAVFRQILKLVK